MKEKESKYHRRPDGRLETTRTDKRTMKRIHFYGYSDREIDAQIMAFTTKAERGRLFKEIADEWEDQHFPTLAPNSLKCYKPAYRRALDEFGEETIRKIRPQDIKRFLTEFARGGRAKKTVTTQLLILSLICGYAVENGDIDVSPCDHVSIPKNLPKSRREAASPQDEAKVKTSAAVWLFPFLVLYTGLRKGEALALTWGDLDMAAEEIRVTKSVYYDGDKPKTKLPKTESGVRTVPILEPLMRELKKLAFGEPDKYVFSDDGLSPLTARRYTTKWDKWAQSIGVAITAHQLRHSYATMLFECNVDIKDAQDLMGHASVAMTQDIYMHLREGRRKATIKALNDKLRAAEMS